MRPRDRRRTRQSRRVARNARETTNHARRVDERLLPGQAPAFAAVRIEMELHLSPNRKPFGDDLEILRLEPLAERRGEDLARLAADQRASVSELAALRERFVDRHIPRLAILDEEDGV